MPWIRLDDQIAHHPKFVAAGPTASWLWICGQSYCARYLTDGLIPASALPTLGVGNAPTKHADALVAVGLWERVDGGYRVHDYHEYQPSKTEVERRRVNRRASGRLGGKRSGVARAKQDAAENEAGCLPGASSGVAPTDEAKSNPVPVPVPRSSPKPSPREGAGEEFWQVWRGLFAETQHGARVLDLEPRNRDIEHVVALVDAFPDAGYLAQLAELFLRLDVPDLRGKPRSLGMLRHWAPWCDAELRKAGVLPKVVAA